MMKAVSILLPDLRAGGAERVCVNLANEFAGRSIEVTVVLMRKTGPLLDALDPRVRIISLNASRPRHVLAPLVRYLRDDAPEAVLVNMWPLTVLAVLARAMAGARCRLVAVEHTTWSVSRLAQRWRTRMMIKGTMRALLPKADAVVAVSRGAAADLEAFSGLRKGSVKTLYNPVSGVRKNADAPLQKSLANWSEGSHKRVLAVGTLKAVKDYPSLLRAFSLLRERMDAKLLILGEGDERPRLEALIQDLDLQDAVRLPGFVDNTSPAFLSADLFVLSSMNEGLPNVVIEALEAGTAVVSTDCPSGPREILDDGKYGTLVPVGDVQALAGAMEVSLSKKHDRAALMGRAREFSVDKAGDAYLDLLLPGWRESER